MSQPTAPRLPPEVSRRLDKVCDRFEASWKAGPRPRLDDFLAGVDGPARIALLRELIAVDVAYRRLAGEVPQPEDYGARFAELDAAWLAEVGWRSGRRTA